MWFKHSQDSVGSSQYPSSNAPDSQCSDFSQINTQDLFSQTICNSGNQNEPQKRMSMYEKWLSKRSMFKRDTLPTIGSDEKGISMNVSGSTVNKPFRTSESKQSFGGIVNQASVQDKEFLQHLKNVFQDSSNEITSALDVFKKKLDSSAEISQEHLSQMLNSFAQNTRMQQEQIHYSINEYLKTVSSSEELLKQVSLKENKISLLEDQLTKSKKADLENLSKNIQDALSLQELALNKKLEDVIKWVKLSNEQQDHHFNEYNKRLEKILKEYKNDTKLLNSKEIDKKAKSDLIDIKDQVEKKINMLQNSLLDELQMMQKKQAKDISDSNKQLVKQINQQTYPMKNLRSQDNEKIIEQFQEMGSKLELNIKNYLINSNCNVSKMQSFITENLHQMIGTMLEKVLGNLISDSLQQHEKRILDHMSSLHPNEAFKFHKDLNHQQSALSRCNPTDSVATTQTRFLVDRLSSTRFTSPNEYVSCQRPERYPIRSCRQRAENNYFGKDTGLGKENATHDYVSSRKASQNENQSPCFQLNHGKIYGGCNPKLANQNNESTSNTKNRKRQYCGGKSQEILVDEIKQKPNNNGNAINYQQIELGAKKRQLRLCFTAPDKCYERQTLDTSSWNKHIKAQANLIQKNTAKNAYKCFTNPHSLANKFQNKASSNEFFTSRSCIGFNNNEINSCTSSPTVSITEVTIKKTKTPYKTRFPDAETIQKAQQENQRTSCPTPTILSDLFEI